ncbi:MAG: GNAT family N-acetyltransferase [Pseudomonadota bacterium]
MKALAAPDGEVSDIATIPAMSGAVLSADSLAPLDLWADHARTQGWVCGYIQLALKNHRLRDLDPDRIVQHNIMIQFDLATWHVDRSVRYKARQAIKKGDKMGAVLVTEKARLLAPFLDLYYPAMVRRGATSVFPQACLEAWAVDPEVVLLGAEIDGRIEAVHLARMHGRHAEQHLAGLSETGRALNLWLIWKATEYFRERGVHHFNIGGAGRPGDSIHWTKRRFNAQEFPLLSMRQVYDQDRFDALCAAAGSGPATDRFPPYRV